MDLLQNIPYSWTKELDPRVADLPFVASSYQVPLIIFAYLYFVLDCGPKFMKNRLPYELKTFMQLYNIIQILANTWLIYDIIDTGLFSGKIICPVLDFSYDRIPMRFTRCVWYFFLLKIWDLVETGIFILRKKNNQVSGLHLYHHISTLFVAWLCVRYYSVVPALASCTINCLIHVIMYTYYFLTACGPNVQKIVASTKQWITTAQMIQFIVLILYLSHPLTLRCNIAGDWLIIVSVIDLTINLFNFRNFYQKTYKQFKKIQ